MPYIKKERRRELSVPSNWTMIGLAQDVGELNYQITCLVDNFISRKELKYSEINSVIGVLECAKMELYRRIAAPYEDKKCKENGDVYSILRVTPLAKGINWEGIDRANKLSKSKRQKTSTVDS